MRCTTQENKEEETHAIVPNPFVAKLYEMLLTADESVVSWLPDNRSFKIRNTRIFEEDVMPSYFAHKKLRHFLGQLKRHGFRHITSGRNFDVFCHELFLKGRPDLLQKIQVKRPFKARKSAVVSPTQASINEDDQTSADESIAGSSAQLEDEKVRPLRQPKTLVKPNKESNEGDPGQLVGASNKTERKPLNTRPTTCGPLRTPGRLRYQPATAPVALRFVPMPDLSMQRKKEIEKWTRPLELNPISKELDDNSRQPTKVTPVKTLTVCPQDDTTTKLVDTSTERPTLENILLHFR